MLSIFIKCFVIFIISLVGTFLIRYLAIKKNIVDIPNERSSHTIPTPRGGGLSLVIVWYCIIIIAYINSSIDFNLFMALMPGIILAIIGLLDDVYTLKPWTRISGRMKN